MAGVASSLAPILEPTPEMVGAVRCWHAAVAREALVLARHGALTREWREANAATRAAWSAVEAAFPVRTGWHLIDGEWWGWTKISRCGLELVHREQLPAGYRARLEASKGANP